MYQGEVNVAEEDLPSFLDVALDLNIKGLSEGTKEDYNSKVERLSQNNIQATSKRKRTSENNYTKTLHEKANTSIETFYE